MTFVHHAVSRWDQSHCTTHHCKREISKTQMNESACFVLNRRLSLTIVNVVFHQLSLAAEILSLFCVVNKVVTLHAVFVIMVSSFVCATKQTLETLKYSFLSLVENDQIKIRTTDLPCWFVVHVMYQHSTN